MEAAAGDDASLLDREAVADLAGLVAIGTVTAEVEKSDGSEANSGEGEAHTSLRDLSLKIERVVGGHGSPGDTVVIVDQIGWSYHADGARRELTESGVRMRVGERLLVVLTPAPEGALGRDDPVAAQQDHYFLVSQAGYFVLSDDGEVVDSDRPNAYVRYLEGLTQEQLVDEFATVCESGCDRTTHPVSGET